MKKHILLTLAAAGLFLAACGEQPAQSSSPTPTPSSDSSVVPTSSSDSSAASSDSSSAASSSSDPSSSSSSEAPTITEVTVAVDEGEKDTIAIGGQTLAVATVTGTGAFSRDVVWSSSDPAIATVAAGVVTGVAAGDVNIIATSAADSTKKGQVTIHVVDKTAGAKTVAQLYADEDLAKLKDDGSESSTNDYVVKAYVAYLSEDYSEQYKNIGFYVIDDMNKVGAKDSKLIQIYRAKADSDVPGIDLSTLKANDYVYVSGKVKNYRGTYEFTPAYVVKVVAGEPLPTVEHIKDATAGKILEVAEATVVAKSTKGYVINDGEAAIYVYENKENTTLEIGDVVSLHGLVMVALGDHGYLQVSNAGLKATKLTGKTPVVENATILTPEIATGLAAKDADTLASHKLYKWTTTIGKSGDYLTYPVAGSETLIEASYPSTELAGKEGDKVNIEAYYVGYDTKYPHACMVIKSIEEWHAAAESIEIQGEDSVAVEDSITLTATVSPAEAAQNVTWDVDNHDLAEIDENGVLTGKAVGTVTVTATHATDTAITQTKTVEIVAAHADPVTGVTVDATADVVIDKTVTLTANVTSAGEDYNPNVTWSSSDATIATVDKNGVVTGVAAGEVTITATTVGKNAAGQHETAQCVVTVNNPYGTLAAPLTCEEMLDLGKDLKNGEYVPYDEIYVRGVVVEAPTYSESYKNYMNMRIKTSASATKVLTVYTSIFDSSLTAKTPCVNDVVVVKGPLTKYSGNLQMNYRQIDSKTRVYPTIMVHEAGLSTITVAENEHVASITGLPTEPVANGTEVSFSVAAKSGYEVVSASIDNKKLPLNDGKYSFTVAGNAEIVITTKVEGDPDPYHYVADTVTLPNGSGNGYADWNTVTDTDGGVNWIAQANVQQHPWRIGGKNLTATKRVVGTTSALSGNISTVTLALGTMNDITVNSITVAVYDSYTGSSHTYGNVVASFTKDATAIAANATLVFTKSGTASTTNGFLVITFDVTVSSGDNKYVQLKTITIDGIVEQ